MTTALNSSRDLPTILREIEQVAVNMSAAIAPAGALFPAAWITADHLIRYMDIPGPAACFMAGGLELMGLAIVSTRVSLIGRSLQEMERRMDFSFGGYLTIVVIVNGILSGVNITGVPTIAAEIGKVVAGLVIALMALPASQLVGVRHELNQMETSAIADKEDASSKYALELADKAAADVRQKVHDKEMLKLQLDAEATEKDKKRAERLQKVSKTPEKVSDVVPIVPVVVPFFPRDIRKLTQEQKVLLSKMTKEEISAAAKVTIKCGGNWLEAFAKEGL